MFVSSLIQKHSRQVVGVETLLNDHLMRLRRIVRARAHGAIPKLDGRTPFRIRSGLIHTVWVVDHDVVAPLTGSGSHRDHHAISSPIVLKTLFLILIAPELKAIGPILLIPI